MIHRIHRHYKGRGLSTTCRGGCWTRKHQNSGSKKSTPGRISCIVNARIEQSEAAAPRDPTPLLARLVLRTGPNLKPKHSTSRNRSSEDS